MVRLEVLSDAEWLSTARKRLQEDGDTSETDVVRLVGVRPAAENGEFGGFIADSLPVRVRVRLSDGSENDLAFFIKAMPTDCEAHTAMAAPAFRKEVTLFEEFFPLMRRLPKDYKASPWAPQVYFTREDILVMEDLIVQGFVERDRRQPFDFEHITISLETLARFHASAWLLELEREKATGRPTPFSQLYPEVSDEGLFVENPKNALNRWFGGAIRGLKKAITLVPKYKSSPDLDKIVEKISSLRMRMIELMQTSTKHRNVLNHGDLWSNNILFRYGKGEDGPPTDVRLVDFQLVRYTPPAVDINCLVYLTTRPRVREDRGGEMLRRYHKALANALSLGGAHVDDFLTWEELVSTCDAFHDVGLIIAPSYHHHSFISPEIFKANFSPENFEKFVLEERDEMIEQCFREDDYYREKVSEELTELVDSFMLNKGEGFWKRAAKNLS